MNRRQAKKKKELILDSDFYELQKKHYYLYVGVSYSNMSNTIIIYWR